MWFDAYFGNSSEPQKLKNVKRKSHRIQFYTDLADVNDMNLFVDERFVTGTADMDCNYYYNNEQVGLDYVKVPDGFRLDEWVINNLDYLPNTHSKMFENNWRISLSDREGNIMATYNIKYNQSVDYYFERN
jgi:hypothetical protein